MNLVKGECHKSLQKQTLVYIYSMYYIVSWTVLFLEHPMQKFFPFQTSKKKIGFEFSFLPTFLQTQINRREEVCAFSFQRQHKSYFYCNISHFFVFIAIVKTFLFMIIKIQIMPPNSATAWNLINLKQIIIKFRKFSISNLKKV